MTRTKKVILITAGDPASISTEITIKAFETKRINKNINIELSSINDKKRKSKRENFEGNKYENMSMNFHKKVREGYLQLANEKRSLWSIVGAHQSESRVADSIWKRVKRLIDNHKSFREI